VSFWLGNLFSGAFVRDEAPRQQRACADAATAQLMALYLGDCSDYQNSPDYLMPARRMVIGREPSQRHKCESCGSREFRPHAGRSVCAYCRSAA
jgi:hypothetical protein